MRNLRDIWEGIFDTDEDDMLRDAVINHVSQEPIDQHNPGGIYIYGSIPSGGLGYKRIDPDGMSVKGKALVISHQPSNISIGQLDRPYISEFDIDELRVENKTLNITSCEVNKDTLCKKLSCGTIEMIYSKVSDMNIYADNIICKWCDIADTKFNVERSIFISRTSNQKIGGVTGKCNNMYIYDLAWGERKSKWDTIIETGYEIQSPTGTKKVIRSWYDIMAVLWNYKKWGPQCPIYFKKNLIEFLGLSRFSIKDTLTVQNDRFIMRIFNKSNVPPHRYDSMVVKWFENQEENPGIYISITRKAIPVRPPWI